ncbi:MAG TPA: response regulator [Povalibacter sp.]|nr:response regulator [Povalibacter sp.]
MASSMLKRAAYTASGSDLGAPHVANARELTIYIVEDSPPVRERLVEAVGDIPNARIVGQAEAIPEALEGVRSSRPRVLILDIQLRGGSGIRLLKQMRAAGVSRPELVIVVTNYPTDDYRRASHECGADHFFDKASEFDKVRDVLLQHESGWRF